MLLTTSLWGTAFVQATEWFVDASACPVTGAGTAQDPFCSIQDGVDASSAGDVVSVAPGTYGSRSLRKIEVGGVLDTVEASLFLKSGVVVRGAGPGASILDAGGHGSVVVADGCDAATRLSGFTLRGGAPGSAAAFDFGDGLFVLGGAPRFADLEITANEGGFAAVDVFAAAPRLEQLSVHDNGAAAPAMAAVLAGEGSVTFIEASVVVGNRGTEAGGVFASDSDVSIVNSVVAGNQGISGGGVRLLRSAGSRLESSTLAANTSSAAGAGLLLEGSSAAVSGCILASNVSLSGQVGGVFLDVDSLAQFSSCDAHGNLGGDYQARLDPTGTDGNISQDPRFHDLQALDLRLTEGSPAIDAGPSPAPAVDLTGARRPLDGDRNALAAPDMGAFEFDRWDVRNLRALDRPFRLTWSTVPGASGYQVYGGRVTQIAAGNFGDCLTQGGDLIDVRFEDPASPAPGEAWSYLVVAHVDGTAGTLGFDSRGLERVPRAGVSCP